MASRWAGWGAGPAGAGAAGGPSRIFLAVAFVGCGVVAIVSAVQARWGVTLLAAAAGGYFALRLFAGLGSGRR
ncbi:MAG TPA: hypothetical protein VML50_13055 [Anaeromyxobacter sp.]|nr:hypothetical protein [Anaeromyxobacter sp.]